MLILSLRTDQPEAELALYEDSRLVERVTWQAHRQLAETLHSKIQDLLKAHAQTWHNLEAIAVYQGPGSFTGLRIGLSVANALADSLKIPIVGTTGGRWQADAVQRLVGGQDEQQVLPAYGAEVRTTLPRK